MQQPKPSSQGIARRGFIAVGMLDFTIKEDSELVANVVRRTQRRERPWLA